MIPKSEDSKSGLLQTCRSIQISHLSISMLPTIDLYHYSPFKTDKIKDISIIRMLSSEFTAVKLPAAQYGPELSLRIRPVLSEHELQLLFLNMLV